MDKPEDAAVQAVGIAEGRGAVTLNGTAVNIEADTLCIHGDTPGAAKIAEAVRKALEDAGVELRAW
jgi:5-oxoprolinase (ATP-hydrolysing) subunit A